MAVSLQFASVAKVAVASAGGTASCSWWAYRIFRNRKIGSIRTKMHRLGIVQQSAVREWLRTWADELEAKNPGDPLGDPIVNPKTRDEIEVALFALVQETEPHEAEDFLSKCARPFLAFVRMLFPFSVSSSHREILELYSTRIAGRLRKINPIKEAGDEFETKKEKVRLERLLEIRPGGEVWRALACGFDATPALSQKPEHRIVSFFTDGTLQAKVRRDSDDIKAEIEALKTVDGIVRPLYFGTDGDGIPFLVTEEVRGASLKSWLTTNAEQRVGLKKAEIIDCLISALAAAHKGGILHRRLDPAQIMLTVPFVPGQAVDLVRAKVSFFCMARLAGDRLDDIYLPPKTGKDSGLSPDGQAAQNDIFALGVIWYQLLIDDGSLERPPYDFYKRLSEFDVSIRDRLERCLAHPDSRWKNAVELSEDKAIIAPTPAPRPMEPAIGLEEYYDVSGLLDDYLAHIHAVPA